MKVPDTAFSKTSDLEILVILSNSQSYCIKFYLAAITKEWTGISESSSQIITKSVPAFLLYRAWKLDVKESEEKFV